MFKSLKGPEDEHEIPKITYNEFLKELKTGCVAIRLNPKLFFTHSLWRGSRTPIANHPNTQKKREGIDKLTSIITSRHLNIQFNINQTSKIRRSIVQHEYLKSLGKVLFNTVTNRILILKKSILFSTRFSYEN
jgi:hypothetical protein